MRSSNNHFYLKHETQKLLINSALLFTHKNLQINDDVVWKPMKRNRPWYRTGHRPWYKISHNGIMQTNWSQTIFRIQNPILKREENYVKQIDFKVFEKLGKQFMKSPTWEQNFQNQSAYNQLPTFKGQSGLRNELHSSVYYTFI